MNCAPKIDNKGYTCFPKESLQKIAKYYNESQQESTQKIKNIKNKTKKSLWLDIRNQLSNKCNKEWCWIDQDFIDNSNKKEMEKYFRPKMPSSWKNNKFTWLTTTDINLVMKQYEEKHNDFLFFGPVPADCPNGFMCELSFMNASKLYKNGYRYIGIIFNLDKHYQPGSHWVAVFINMKNQTITYYDSYGSTPPGLINAFEKSVANNIKMNLKKDMVIQYNTKRHQYGGSECGVYSMNFIIESLKGKELPDIEKMKISDRIMNEMRKYLYRNYN
jgi:Ulp1 family protease